MCFQTGTSDAAFSRAIFLLVAVLTLAFPRHSAWCQPVFSGEYEQYTGIGADEGLEIYSMRTRLRLRARYATPTMMIYTAGRLSYDLQDPQNGGSPGPVRPRLLESFVDFYFDNLDVRIGHQLIVWGQFDGTFITDFVSPLDLTEFLAQDFTDIRLAVPAALASYYVGSWSLTGLVTAAPRSSPIPSVRSPWFAIPEDFESIDVTLREDNLPSLGIDAVEPGMKVTYSGPQTTASVLYFYGRNRIPAFAKEVTIVPGAGVRVALRPEYYSRHVVGARMSSTALDAVILEFEGTYESRYELDADPSLLLDLGGSDTLSDDDLLISHGRLHGGVSVARTEGETLVRVQLLGTLLTRYDSRSAQDRFEEAVSLLIQTSWSRQTYSARAFGYYRPGGDYWVNPVLRYSAGRGANVELGAHVFGGDSPNGALSTSTFGLFGGNDFGYLRFTLAF